MSLCCETPKFDGLSAGFKRALWIIIAINGTMFVVEMIAGLAAGSKALQADALDFLGDAATYSLTLAVIGMPLHTRALAAMVKGLSMIGLGLWIFGSTLYQVLILNVPSADVMGAVGSPAGPGTPSTVTASNVSGSTASPRDGGTMNGCSPAAW